MKKIILVIIVLTFIPSLCFAKESKAPAVKTTAKVEAKSVPEEKTTAAKIKTPSLSEEKTTEAEIETQPLSEAKTAEVNVESKSAPKAKNPEAKVEVKPASGAKALEVKAKTKAVDKKAKAVSEEKDSAPKLVTGLFAGKVISATSGDVTASGKAEIMVISDNGQMMAFLIKSDTPITVANGKAIKLGDVQKDGKVIIEYAMDTKDGIKVKSIKLQ
ncbi:MAG: hypothetical protein Q8O22_00545 [Candidatus Omnitrophota bacterium]|nr:hypothetical protein [Candidatus Omnitrophota bacterium]